jgi:hypothetical protein
VNLTTHLHPVPRSRMRSAIPPLPQYAIMAWCLVKKEQGQLYLLPFAALYMFYIYIYIFGLITTIALPQKMNNAKVKVK